MPRAVRLLSNPSKRFASSTLWSPEAQTIVSLENQYCTHNYHPLPVVLEKGLGIHVWDVDGKQYYDFLSAYSAVNQGHCHPKILATLQEQAQKLTLCSRAFHSNLLGPFAEFVCNYFDMDMVLAMNTGVEACESSIKIARRWGYEKKGIVPNQAKVIFVAENFWGRTISAVSSSTDPESFNGYGPYTPGFEIIPYDDLFALETALKDPNVCAFMCEPIQGEAGVKVPQEGYLKGIRKLCDKYNVLWIADEVQTGCGRTGKRLCVDWENVQPDMITLGKAISGGFFPVSAVVGKQKCMDVLTPGTHGSTYGGNPLGAAVAMKALEVLEEEKLAENANEVGQYLRQNLKTFASDFEFIESARGKGLLNAIVIKPDHHTSAWDVCMELKNNGLLAKPTHDHIIRLAPPLCITKNDIDNCLNIMHETFQQVA